jgi:hypothetical protein
MDTQVWDAIFSSLPVVALGIITFAISWYYLYSQKRREEERIRQERDSARRLVSFEMIHNMNQLYIVRGYLGPMAQAGDERKVLAYLSSKPALPADIQLARWNLPDVAEHLSLLELYQIGFWNMGVSMTDTMYQNLIQSLAFSTESIHTRISAIVDHADLLLNNRPPLPEPDLQNDPSVVQYEKTLRESVTRQASSSHS